MGFSHWELLIFAGVILLLFGGSRLPSLMRNMGRSVTEFKRGMHGIDDGSDEKESSESASDSSSTENSNEKVEA